MRIRGIVQDKSQPDRQKPHVKHKIKSNLNKLDIYVFIN
jgi:hypothetical protein